MNWIPGLSQVKSTVQLIRGDVDGAVQTQKDFFRQCPVVSQAVGVTQLVVGDKQGAQETFRQGSDTISSVVDDITGRKDRDERRGKQ